MSHRYNIENLTMDEMISIKHLVRVHKYLKEAREDMGERISPTMEELAIECEQIWKVINDKERLILD